MLPYLNVWSSEFIHSPQPPLPFSKLSVFYFLILLQVLSNPSQSSEKSLSPTATLHQHLSLLSPVPFLPASHTSYHTGKSFASYILSAHGILKHVKECQGIRGSGMENQRREWQAQRAVSTEEQWLPVGEVGQGFIRALSLKSGEEFYSWDKVGKRLAKFSAGPSLCTHCNMQNSYKVPYWNIKLTY